jgi:radical SAM superfamily enzyme YgiQ (UPF0313 family)
MIAYPPLESPKGVPLLSQNRQFQWFNSPTYIYPMVPASMATLLSKKGYEVIWADGIAEEWSYDGFKAIVDQERPDLVVIETKTPVVKRHWKIIDDLKKQAAGVWDLKIALIGDHVTALPEESMKNSQVDFVVTGGDYDFLLLSLVNSLTDGGKKEPGIWLRENGEIANTGPFVLDNDLNALPIIDRDLTKWHLYSEKNGNYKYLPGTYTMVARDCWWGRCSFCSWTTLYPGSDYRSRTPQSLLDEIGILIEKYGVKEVMDDSGTFPVGTWLREFCQGMIERGYNKKVRLDCNMRFGKLSGEDYRLMREAGFRFILFGLESGNQKTLDRITKNIKVEDIELGLRSAKAAGLEPHITVMMGYPWETLEDTQRTIALAHDMFKKGYVDTLQATIVMPYPGTPLFKICDEEGCLKTKDWDRYDMRDLVIEGALKNTDAKTFTRDLYKSFITPGFVIRKIISIRKPSDLAFVWRAGWKLIGHLRDFGSRGEGSEHSE